MSLETKWLKMTQNDAKWLRMTAATLVSIFIYHLSSVIYKIIGSNIKVDFCVMFILDLILANFQVWSEFQRLILPFILNHDFTASSSLTPYHNHSSSPLSPFSGQSKLTTYMRAGAGLHCNSTLHTTTAPAREPNWRSHPVLTQFWSWCDRRGAHTLKGQWTCNGYSHHDLLGPKFNHWLGS